MKITKLTPSLAICALVLSTLACNIGSAAPSAANTPPPAAETEASLTEPSISTSISTEAPTTAASACDNPYLPVIVGATWNYTISGPIPDTFTRSIISANETSFTDQDVFGTGVTRQGQWACEAGAVTALDPTSGNSASVNSENISVDFETTSASGVTLPATLNSGDTWTQTVTLEGTETINGQAIPAKNEFSNVCTVIGPETITVTAGTFDAIHIDCVTTMNIIITLGGASTSTPIVFNASNWYADNVGLLKTVSTGNGLDGTVELTGYNIP